MPMEEIPNRSAKDVSTFLFEVYDSD